MIERYSDEHIEKVQQFIKEHNKKRTFKQRLRTKYLGYKFRIEDWLYKIKNKPNALR